MFNECRSRAKNIIHSHIVYRGYNGKKRCLFCENSGKTMSEYFKNLLKTAKRRYEEKIKDIGVENVENGDPFLV